MIQILKIRQMIQILKIRQMTNDRESFIPIALYPEKY